MLEVAQQLLKTLSLDVESLGNLLEVAEAIGVDKTSLESDLKSVIVERIFMQLVSHVDGQLNFLERKNVVRRRLEECLGSELTSPQTSIDGLVDAIASAQARVAEASESGKKGKANVYNQDWDEIMQSQGYRCRICGVALSARVRGKCSRFPDGLEPICKAALDHILPFYLGSNLGNYQLLCEFCNNLKNDYVGVQEDGIVLTGNFLRQRRGEQVRRRMMLWTLWRNPKCGYEGCDRGFERSLLWVAKRHPTTPFSYGNLSTYCSLHAPEASHWLHA